MKLDLLCITIRQNTKFAKEMSTVVLVSCKVVALQVGLIIIYNDREVNYVMYY